MQKGIMKTEMILLSVPADMLLEAGIHKGDPMQMYVEGRRLIIENLDDINDFICDNDCQRCPINKMDCDGVCPKCPCSNYCGVIEAND